MCWESCLHQLLSVWAAGFLAGLALVLALSAILKKWAQGSSHDPLILLAGIVLLSMVSAVACAVPARHASRVDPIVTLPYE
jgi:ABC-type antimicrobial peptide transport system permease subunit